MQITKAKLLNSHKIIVNNKVLKKYEIKVVDSMKGMMDEAEIFSEASLEICVTLWRFMKQ